ncbi:phage baseplate protein [Aquibacillus saliphilus]|uniref:phage baseplate protein n=1 Tax=Aquibacillus saliphilus TaxID=1909422 RepID=UPI001CEFD140|nr:teichoic acid biosynthesis protein [Aquibacillus saliphilus]
MSSNTINYNLIKPETSDNIGVTISDLANNFETVDVELDYNKTENNSLREDVNENSTRLGNINKKFDDFNFTKVSPSYYDTLHLPSDTVMQCMVINEQTNEMYVSQLDGQQTGVETYLLSRFTLEGVYLDNMKLINGGHSTSFGIENIDNDVYIWSNYENEAGTTYDLARFKYTPNTTLTEDSSEIQRYDKFTTEYVVPAIDQKNGRIAFRVKHTETTQTIELRDLSDVKNGTDDILASYEIPTSINYMQGMSIDGYDLYWYSGDSDATNYPSVITLVDMQTGVIKEQLDANFGKGINGYYEENFHEPESIYLYTEPQTGSKSLFAGMVTDEAVRRNNKIYAFHSVGNESKFFGMIAQKLQAYRLTQSDGSAKRIPTKTTLLSTIKETGYYYFSSIDFAEFSDLPSGMTSGGAYLEVTPQAPNNGTFHQRLTRHTSVGNFQSYIREITDGTTVGSWYSINMSSSLVWKNIPLQNGASNETDYPFQYAQSGTTGYIRGRVNVPSTDGVTFATIPEEARPKQSTYFNASVAGTTGFRKVMIDSLGNASAYGVLANDSSAITFLYLDMTYPLG